MPETLNVENLVQPDALAAWIGNEYDKYKSLRVEWEAEKKELRNYLYATDTRTTSNKSLPWANKTTTPKLTQIYDNLKANYLAALFPNTNWMRWEADTQESSGKAKAKVITDYIRAKLRAGNFELEMDKLVDDFIIYGNCFAVVDYVTDYNEVDGVQVPSFVGPKVKRVSPHDIVFSPTASSFQKTPKIIRSLVGYGEVKKMIDEGDESFKPVWDKIMTNRSHVHRASAFDKSEGFVADGFSSIELYYQSPYIEILTFYGDIYDADTATLHLNKKVQIVDRAYVVYNEDVPSWLGRDPVYHAGWRNRPDNLYAMGPLDNLVGLQYRIDHLENLRADVFDQIALPALKIRGDVEEFTYAPGTKIILGEEGDVAPIVPDATALQADLQINILADRMEEMAGAPRQAMGIRTPGEKTAFEVRTLENSASRIFQHKASKFEKEFIEPILNGMLEAARRNMNTADEIRVFDDELKANIFKTVTREDIKASGVLRPIGARHFAERATRIQNLNQLMQLRADPTIGAHLSGKEIAKIVAYELGEEALFGENISVTEQLATQSAVQDAEADNAERLMTQAEQGL